MRPRLAGRAPIGRAVIALSILVAPLALAEGEPASTPRATDWALSVEAFGAVGDGETDDTRAIQAAIDKVRDRGGAIYMPAGTYLVSSLDLTNIARGLALVGDGVNATRLMPVRDGVHVLDLSGSRFVHLRDFQVGAFNQPTVPRTAILLGQVASLASNALHLESLYVTGKYSVATLYCYGVPSSTALDCDFYNYRNADVPVVAFTHDNYAAVQSDHAALMAGFSSCSDWTWVGCEIHELARPSGRTPATALRLDGTTQMRWIGGNISGAGPQLVLFTDHPKCTLFEGTTFYSETGTPAKAVFFSRGAVEGLSVVQCMTQAADAIFAGAPEVVYDNIHFVGKPTAMGFSGAIVDCPRGMLTDSVVHCDGLALRVGTIRATLLLRSGKITGDASGALVIGGQQ